MGTEHCVEEREAAVVTLLLLMMTMMMKMMMKARNGEIADDIEDSYAGFHVTRTRALLVDALCDSKCYTSLMDHWFTCSSKTV